MTLDCKRVVRVEGYEYKCGMKKGVVARGTRGIYKSGKNSEAYKVLVGIVH